MTNKFLLFTAIAALSVGTANAEAFNGVYAGISAGYVSGNADLSYTDVAPVVTGSFTRSADPSGLDAGIFLGYRAPVVGDFGLGVEVFFDISNADDSISETIGVNTVAIEAKKRRAFGIVAKPSYQFSDKFQGFTLLGYQRANYEAEAFLNGTSLGSEDDNFGGFKFGLGGEYAWNDSFSVRAEVARVNYSDNTYTYVGGDTESYDIDETSIKIGLTYNF